MTTVVLAGNGFGGVVQGNFGNYQAASDGTFTVDARDAPPLLAQGMGYVKQSVRNYTLPLAPAVATVAGVVSSTALSNGTLAVGTQPAVPRKLNVEFGTGTTAITAGTLTLTYVGNDGATTVDTFSAVCALSSVTTVGTSKGVVTISSISIAGVAGGTSPWVRISTTNDLALPVDPGAVDFAVQREWDAGATVAVGTLSAALGCITPTTTPNSTVTYSFNYSFLSPVT